MSLSRSVRDLMQRRSLLPESVDAALSAGAQQQAQRGYQGYRSSHGFSLFPPGVPPAHGLHPKNLACRGRNDRVASFLPQRS